MTTYTVSIQPGRGQPLQEIGQYDAPDGQAAIGAAERQHGQREGARWWAVCHYEQIENRSNDAEKGEQ